MYGWQAVLGGGGGQDGEQSSLDNFRNIRRKVVNGCTRQGSAECHLIQDQAEAVHIQGLHGGDCLDHDSSRPDPAGHSSTVVAKASQHCLA